MPLLTIIIPVYNAAVYLSRCLDSVIGQTYKNLEIICIDDKSTDESRFILEKYANDDSRITIIYQRSNMGPSEARNAGLSIAKGDIFTFVDSDDWIESDMYEIMIDAYIKNKADIAICGHYVITNDHYEKCTNDCFFDEDKILDKREAMYLLAEDEKIKSHSCNKLFNKNLFTRIRYDNNNLFEDVLIMHRLFINADKIAVVGSYKYYYFKRPESRSSGYTYRHRMDHFIAYYSRYLFLKSSLIIDQRTLDTALEKALFYSMRVLCNHSFEIGPVNRKKVLFFLKDNSTDISRIAPTLRSLRTRILLHLPIQSLIIMASLLYNTAGFQIFRIITNQKNHNQ